MACLPDTTRFKIEWVLTLSLGNAWERLRSPDATFAEITALDPPESMVNSDRKSVV